MYLRGMALSTWEYFGKLFTNTFFYIGGVVMGIFFYLTGLSVTHLSSILIVIFLDIGTRCWAEKTNNRSINSRKMFLGFGGKFSAYMILFILAHHSFVFQEYFTYLVLGGFSIVESRSVFENLMEVRQGKQIIKFIKSKINEKFDEFTGGNKEDQKDKNE